MGVTEVIILVSHHWAWANTKQLHLPVTETIVSSMYFLINFTAVVIIVLKREKKNKAMLSARSSTPL